MLKDKAVEPFIRSWRLVPASGGRYELTINDALVFSKKALARHAEPGEAKRLILARLRELVPNYDTIIAAMQEEKGD